MLFVPKCEEVVFVSKRSVQKKDKNGSFCIVTIADPTTYENLDLFPENEQEFDGIAQGEMVLVEIDISGRFSRLRRVG